jgi:hypothetical protein
VVWLDRSRVREEPLMVNTTFSCGLDFIFYFCFLYRNLKNPLFAQGALFFKISPKVIQNVGGGELSSRWYDIHMIFI